MSAYLVGEDGPHTGVTITFENGEEWILGRDPDLCYFALEDPMVSRKHALLRFSEEGYFLENLSTINPILVNGSSLQEPIKLKEDDLVQIGNSFSDLQRLFQSNRPPWKDLLWTPLLPKELRPRNL